jgi:hypothetical protein
MKHSNSHRLTIAVLVCVMALVASSGASASNDRASLSATHNVPYKVYTAILKQNGANAPTATVLENTLGKSVTWSRDGVGSYAADVSGGFVSGTYVIQVHKWAGFAWAFMNTGTLLLYTYNASNSLADGELNLSSWIEIREY